MRLASNQSSSLYCCALSPSIALQCGGIPFTWFASIVGKSISDAAAAHLGMCKGPAENAQAQVQSVLVATLLCLLVASVQFLFGHLLHIFQLWSPSRYNIIYYNIILKRVVRQNRRVPGQSMGVVITKVTETVRALTVTRTVNARKHVQYSLVTRILAPCRDDNHP
jgi:hypothetical protein